MKLRTSILTSLLILQIISYGQYQNFVDSYGVLSTVAGKGASDDGNEWVISFENDLATNVELSRPHFAMSDLDGNIYIADKESHGIRKINTDGTISTVAGTNEAGDNATNIGTQCQLNSPNGLWVSKGGTVYILDLGNNKIRRLNKDGSIETIVDDTDGYTLGRGLWVTKNQDSIFYANSSQIKLWTANNGIEIYADGFSSLGNIMQDMNGHLVVTNRGSNVVHRIDKNDQTKTVIAGNGNTSDGGDGHLATETGLHGVRGIWFLEDNSYFLATHEGSQIWYVDVLGVIHLFLDGYDDDDSHFGDGENYNTPGYKISEARSVSVDYQGNVIICENDQGFIRKIEKKYPHYYTSNKLPNNSKIRVYPNPANQNINISSSINIQEVELINTMAQLIFKDSQLNQRSYSINLDKIIAGFYFLKVKTANKDELIKIQVY